MFQICVFLFLLSYIFLPAPLPSSTPPFNPRPWPPTLPIYSDIFSFFLPMYIHACLSLLSRLSGVVDRFFLCFMF